ncbi:amidohydrolase [uncultured Rikenella sp.]|uniref:amidohydrolase n=1 Tax=uncultured Rikenella sp. TaxID=368003 RepID=UPI0025F37350|nr:amidohydrolase [uncultured Rikenella sp.]
MDKLLKLAVFQMDTQWEAPSENCRRVTEWVDREAGDADLIVLPEMFATGFSMEPERIAQEMDGEVVSFLRGLAMRTGKAIITSVAIRDHIRRTEAETGYFNRLFFVAPDGVWLTYNKRHLFRMGGEHEHYAEGSERRLIVHYKGFRICPMICYDLRFPVFSRNRKDYDLLLYVASWPEARRYAWSTLLRARAIENQAYVVGCNRCGTDPGNSYSGDSVVLDFLGQPLAEAVPGQEEMIHATLSLDELEGFRQRFPAHLDADDFTWGEE